MESAFIDAPIVVNGSPVGLPAMLSAFIDDGLFRVAMMGDQSLRKVVVCSERVAVWPIALLARLFVQASFAYVQVARKAMHHARWRNKCAPACWPARRPLC